MSSSRQSEIMFELGRLKRSIVGSRLLDGTEQRGREVGKGGKQRIDRSREKTSS